VTPVDVHRAKLPARRSPMLAGRLVVSVSLVLGACGDDGAGPVDAAIVPVDIDNGSCGDQVRFTGRVHRLGQPQQLLRDQRGRDRGCRRRGDGQHGANGRFDLCAPDAPTTRLDVTQPAGNSQCTTPPSGYSVPTILFANKAVIQSGGFFSGRSFTTARQATFLPDDRRRVRLEQGARVRPHRRPRAHGVDLGAAWPDAGRCGSAS